MRKILKNMLSHTISFVLGICVSIGLAAYAATQISSSQVTYTGNSQSTVNGALDDLYTKANTWIDPQYIDFETLAANDNGTILASSTGVCIKSNGKVGCLKINNYDIEKERAQEIFESCQLYNSTMMCDTGSINCNITPSGAVGCTDWVDDSSCGVEPSGNVMCSPDRYDWIDPSYIDFTTLATNSAKTILASSSGICIKRNGTVSCMKKGNWSKEKSHIQEIFNDVSCSVSSSDVRCDASDFGCRVFSSGGVFCGDISDRSTCNVDAGSSVRCN